MDESARQIPIVNKIAKKVGKEMSKEIVNFELLDEYYVELQNVHESKKFGRFAQSNQSDLTHPFGLASGLKNQLRAFATTF